MRQLITDSVTHNSLRKVYSIICGQRRHSARSDQDLRCLLTELLGNVTYYKGLESSRVQNVTSKTDLDLFACPKTHFVMMLFMLGY